jgi:hypothetical protein
VNRTALVLLWCAACGDNRAPRARDDAAPADASTACVPVTGGTVDMRLVVEGCTMGTDTSNCMDGVVTLVTSPPADKRLFALELTGKIRIIEDGVLRPTPFLDMAAIDPYFIADAELGLLGLAFHPQYATNRELYVYYTTRNPDPNDTMYPYFDVLARFTTSETDPYVVDPASKTVLYALPDPFGNHQGGMLAFGPLDGYLYISTGDGGGNGDPYRLPQDTSTLFGKILRIDVDHQDAGKPYRIPADNPFGNEVWMLGFRNPWRFEFDRATGDMWIGDVGHAEYEELDVVRAGDQRGRNFGWSMWEANSCFHPPCTTEGMTFPQSVHDHANDGWWSIIGGEVYRGTCYPDLVGTYFYTDTGYGHLTTAKLQPDGTLIEKQLPGEFVGTIFQPTSLHADASGELYLTQFRGHIYKLVVEGGTPVE